MSAPDVAVADWVQRLAPPKSDEPSGSSFVGAPADDAWRTFVRQPPELRASVVRALKARVDDLVRNAPPAARPVGEALVRAAQGLPELLPLALRGRAAAAHFNGDEERARADFERAVELYEESGREVDAAATRRSLVDVYQMSGDSAAALACAERARLVLEANGQTRLLAQLHVNVGNVHTRLDDYPAAGEHYRTARELFAGLGDAVGQAFADFNLAVVEMNGDRVDAAERRWLDARRGMEAAGMGLLVADCDYNLAYLQSRRGRFELAIEGLERARRAYGKDKPSGPPLCDLDLAEIHLRLDARRDALAYATRAVDRFAALGLEYERARAEVLAGIARARLGERDEALDDLARAAERFARLGNRSFASCVEIQRASLQIDAGAARAVAARLQTAEATLRRRGMPWLAELAALVRARAQLALGEARAALEILRRLDAPREDGELRDGLLESLAWRLQAEAHEMLGDPQAALAALRRAVEGIESSYAQVPAGDVRMAFFRDQHPAFVDLAFALLAAERPREALVVLEQGRSRSLREVPLAAGGDAASFRAARERLDWLLSRRLDDQLGFAAGRHELRVAEPAAGRREDWSRAIAETRGELARLAARRGPSGALPRLSAAELVGARRGDELLVIYMTGPRGTCAWLHHDDDAEGPLVESVSLPLSEQRLAGLRDHLLFQMGRLQLGGAYVARHEGSILEALDSLFAELGDRLLAPIRDRHLQRMPAGRPLVIVPYGRLHDLPFHAFRLDGAPLVERHDVAYGLSAWQLARARAKARAPREETLDSGVIWTTGIGQESLPHVERELGRIQELYGPDCRRLEPDALCARLRAGGIRGRMLHIAGHGRFESSHPRFSAIGLGQTSLLAHDFSDMDLHLDLVTLSGCETGRTLRIGGDELLGLPRALVGAGVRAVLASHWPVDDGDAASFMEKVYYELAIGSTARHAVAEAQRRLRSRAAQPLSWAAFSLLGDPDVTAPAASP